MVGLGRRLDLPKSGGALRDAFTVWDLRAEQTCPKPSVDTVSLGWGTPTKVKRHQERTCLSLPPRKTIHNLQSDQITLIIPHPPHPLRGGRRAVFRTGVSGRPGRKDPQEGGVSGTSSSIVEKPRSVVCRAVPPSAREVGPPPECAR